MLELDVSQQLQYNNNTMKHTYPKLFFYAAGAILAATLVLSCQAAESRDSITYKYPAEDSVMAGFPEAGFAVISDLHLYNHPSLGSSGAAFEKTMNADRKLLLDSIDLLDYTIKTIILSDVSFVLISGDLTKDGELINHTLAARKLKTFTDAGIAVYVIPGNHDINNPGAVSYHGDSTVQESTVSAEEFALIYDDYGYGSALFRDDDSLSYVAEPVEGLWLLAIDACRYRENEPGKEEIVSGKISQRTADWMAGVLQAAMNENKAVMAMMHHGVVEHWKGQSKLHPDYLINGYEKFGKFLASWNVRTVFTGHYHAQDIALGQFGEKFIWDIETGSLITAPCPVRYINFTNNYINVATMTIVNRLHPGTDFADKAHAFVKKTVVMEARSVLKKYRVSDKDADYIADAVGDAFAAHYSGDENPELRPLFEKSKLGLWGRFVYNQQKYTLDGLWSDPPPADNYILEWLMGDQLIPLDCCSAASEYSPQE